LKRERRTLEETQATLHRMLSILLDASCSCTADGTIISSTPHLEQLLRGGSDLVGSNLCEFAANDADVRRMSDFLHNTARSALNQALSLQCAVRPQLVGSSQDKTACDLETTLYSIRFSSGALFNTPSSNSDREHLFLGLKAAIPDVYVPDVLHAVPHPTNLFDDWEMWAPPQSTVEGGAELSSLFCSEEAVAEDRKRPYLGRRPLKTSAVSKDSSLGLTVSSAPSRRCHLRCVSTQTEHTRCSNTTLHCQSTQTKMPPVRSQLPLLPESDRDLQRPHVTLNTKRRMNRQFALTPDSTVDQLVCESVQKFNRRGKGCCLWHIGLQSLNRRVSCLIASRCRKDLVLFVPGQHWQCEACKVIHDGHDGGDDGDQTEDDSSFFCDFCDHEQRAPPMFQSDSSSESGPAVDA